ncbi:hypothetical protein AC578_1434 [Pseudocercospora eumusae]|uniref:Oxidase ustYa n=1 Tax=Pseudocercospora eumusae TaxID=321146 RepID=A0A139HUS9_9PEZI|nr:hypothetical protein AC578_1434 [Pseudocercospora eumusae]
MPSSQKYEATTAASAPEDHHTLLGHRRISRTLDWTRKSYRLHHILLSAITGAIAAAGLLILTLLVSSSPRIHPRQPHFYPDLPFNTPKIFNEDPKFINGSWEAEFAKLLPRKHPSRIPSHPILSDLYNILIHKGEHGFIRVPNPSQYGLHGGYPLDHNAESYSISMFHQIHCVLALKQDFHNALDLDPETLHHAEHCFEYLRQAVMCAGDLTLEKMKTDEEGRPVRDVIGWGVRHECRDWESMVEWADRFGDKSVREGEILGHHLHGGG